MTFRALLPTGLIQMLPNRIAPVLCIAAVVLVSGSQTNAQEECEKYHRWDRTVFVTQPITENRLVKETSFETVKETKYRTVRQSEDRERTVIEEKPVTQTSERVQRTVVPKKITETKYRTVRRVENSFEDVTEVREEKYTVRKPVTETTIREEKVTVRKPITETQVKKEQITTLKPKSFRQTAQVPGTLLVPGVTGSRPRARWLSRGWYDDNTSGRSVWRRPGLHWVQEPQFGQAAVPVVVPQEIESVALVPETVTVEKPVQVTRFVDEVETRKIPTTINRVVEETRTRKVPYTVRVPKKKIIEQEIPYQETRYVDEVIERVVPVTETVIQQVRRTEPYKLETAKWVPYVSEKQIPKVTTRRVPYKAMYRVPYIVQMEQKLDAFDRPLGPPRQVAGTERLHPNWKTKMEKVTEPVAASKPSQRPVVETSLPSPPAESVWVRPSAPRSVADTPAKFDIKGGTEEPAGAVPSGSGSRIRTEVVAVEAADELGPPPNIEFPATNKPSSVATGEFTDLRKLSAETSARKEALKKAKTPESAVNRFLNERTRDNLRRVGLTQDQPEIPVAATESTVEIEETSAPVVAPVIVPQLLELDVDSIPAATRPDEGPATIILDDTIERDVEVLRPDRT